MIKWLREHRLHVFNSNQLHDLKAACLTEGFSRGMEAGKRLERMEWTGKGIVLAGFDAVKEAEAIANRRPL